MSSHEQDSNTNQFAGRNRQAGEVVSDRSHETAKEHEIAKEQVVTTNKEETREREESRNGRR